VLSSQVIDNDRSRQVGEFDDVSRVQKYELTEEEYQQRNGEAAVCVHAWYCAPSLSHSLPVADTVLKFKMRNKMGRFAEDAEEKQRIADEEGANEAQGVSVNARCRVSVDAAFPRLGTVRFVGKTSFKPGWWIGVQYDEPVGKNDGRCVGRTDTDIIIISNCHHVYSRLLTNYLLRQRRRAPLLYLPTQVWRLCSALPRGSRGFPRGIHRRHRRNVEQ
jgi:hypothetical protein